MGVRVSNRCAAYMDKKEKREFLELLEKE